MNHHITQTEWSWFWFVFFFWNLQNEKKDMKLNLVAIKLAKFSELNFLFDDVQRTIENRINDASYGVKSTNNCTDICCEMAQRTRNENSNN